MVTDADCACYLTVRGKGWVAEAGQTVVGFAIADLQDHNIWALFVHPQYEKQGIGKGLHRHMVDWYFSQTKHPLWLGTAPHTRAAEFYRRQGWTQTGWHGIDELKFEMRIEDWEAQKQSGAKIEP